MFAACQAHCTTVAQVRRPIRALREEKHTHALHENRFKGVDGISITGRRRSGPQSLREVAAMNAVKLGIWRATVKSRMAKLEMSLSQANSRGKAPEPNRCNCCRHKKNTLFTSGTTQSPVQTTRECTNLLIMVLRIKEMISLQLHPLYLPRMTWDESLGMCSSWTPVLCITWSCARNELEICRILSHEGLSSDTGHKCLQLTKVQ